MKRPLTIIKAGNATPAVQRQFGDFEEWLIEGLGVAAQDIRLVRVVDGEPLPLPEACGGVVITGSHAMVTDNLPWSVAVASWLPAVVERQIPLLGICYGHQLLAAAMGGQVNYHPRGPEIGTTHVELLPAAADDPLFAALPDSFPVQAFHSQSILSLPPQAVLLARNDFEPHHAFRLGTCAWGVQFHPEYTREIMAAEIVAGRDELIGQGLAPADLLATAQACPAAASLLLRFGALAQASA